MSGRDEFERILKWERPTRFVKPEEFCMVFTPGEHNEGGEVDENGRTIGLDWFGCSWTEVGKGAVDGATLTPGMTLYEDMEKRA